MNKPVTVQAHGPKLDMPVPREGEIMAVYTEVEYQFPSIPARDAFLDEYFPKRKTGNAPGYYTLPDGDSLILVNINCVILRRRA